MTALVSLPMYDFPELRAATDAWWRTLAGHLRSAGVPDVPDRLARGIARETGWRCAGLLLTQTCGYPLTHDYAGVLSALAVPHYRAAGCEPGCYRSAFVIRDTDPAAALADFRGRAAAVNGSDSHSGCNALRAAVAPLSRARRFFDRVLWTGSHRLSLEAVKQGGADLAAIDGVTLELLSRVAPDEVDGLRVLAWSAAAPALPYATRRNTSADLRARLRDGLLRAAADPGATVARDTLLLDGISETEDAAYDVIADMRMTAEALGFSELS